VSHTQTQQKTTRKQEIGYAGIARTSILPSAASATPESVPHLGILQILSWKASPLVHGFAPDVAM
jgi:hypothetical protein